jgi:hypothetical protein
LRIPSVDDDNISECAHENRDARRAGPCSYLARCTVWRARQLDVFWSVVKRWLHRHGRDHAGREACMYDHDSKALGGSSVSSLQAVGVIMTVTPGSVFSCTVLYLESKSSTPPPDLPGPAVIRPQRKSSSPPAIIDSCSAIQQYPSSDEW